jgi:hypothetical protein
MSDKRNINQFNMHVDYGNPHGLVPRNLNPQDIRSAHALFPSLGYHVPAWKISRAISSCGYQIRGFFRNHQYPACVWLTKHGNGFNELKAIGIDRSLVLPQNAKAAILQWTRDELPSLPTRLSLTSQAVEFFGNALDPFFLTDSDDDRFVYHVYKLSDPRASAASTSVNSQGTEAPLDPQVPCPQM